MKREREDFLTLIASLETDLRLLEELVADNQQAVQRLSQGADTSLDLGAWGYTLHGAYNLYENYFLRISKFFENHLPSEAWHQELLNRMRLSLAPLRPALIEDEELFYALDDLRAFRHVFRHNYGTRLRVEKLLLVQKAFGIVLERFPSAHQRFVANLVAVSELVK